MKTQSLYGFAYQSRISQPREMVSILPLDGHLDLGWIETDGFIHFYCEGCDTSISIRSHPMDYVDSFTLNPDTYDSFFLTVKVKPCAPLPRGLRSLTPWRRCTPRFYPMVRGVRYTYSRWVPILFLSCRNSFITHSHGTFDGIIPGFWSFQKGSTPYVGDIWPSITPQELSTVLAGGSPYGNLCYRIRILSKLKKLGWRFVW